MFTQGFTDILPTSLEGLIKAGFSEKEALRMARRALDERILSAIEDACGRRPQGMALIWYDGSGVYQGMLTGTDVPLGDLEDLDEDQMYALRNTQARIFQAVHTVIGPLCSPVPVDEDGDDDYEDDE